MPLSTPLASPGPVRSRYEDHETLEDAARYRREAARVQQTMALSGFGDVVTGPSELHAASEPLRVQSSESATKTATLSHTHKDKDKSDGLSKLESKFLDSVDTTEIRKFHGAYASVPHPAGSHQDYKTALFTAEQFESFGLKAEIVEYYPLLSLPIHRKLSILAPNSCTSNEDALPPYLGYSDSGNVTASVVYVNYARPVDFQWLKDNNVTLEGKIALVRYGGNFRGLKVMLAEQHGMAGVLIYSDPLDDGYAQGLVYPEGPWRPEGSFQRGSVQYNSIYGGDPLTPGFPSLPGEPYLSKEECKTIPHIPTLPLSYGQARYILESLEGKKAPESWQGALNLENGGYFVGDDEATYWSDLGRYWYYEGTEEPDQMIIIGNHRDAGSAVMLEIARGLGDLLKDGWKPRRTLVIASWDGEELGLLGSTEFAEDHAELLKKQAVAYVNVDNVVGPFVSSGGTPSIAKFLQETAQLIPGNPFHGVEVTENLYEQWVSQTAIRRSSLAVGADDGTLAPDHLIQFLGSGTDFTAFYTASWYHLGELGLHHPHYATHTTMARWWGLITLRLVDNAIVPFDFSTYGLVMQEDLAGYEKIHGEMGRNVDYAELHEASKIFQARIAEFAEKNPKKKKEIRKLETERHFWNEKLVSLERYLLSDAGLPHRPWFKHMIFGPGFYEGYKGAAFPGLSDCIVFEDDNTAIQTHVDDVAAVIKTAAAFLRPREKRNTRKLGLG
ncbi:Glutamate carboxypeptidase-like protein [Phytophthora cactorum]|nr:Glutamate carboxypeptidase-like protein [Phytophthora cactorum]